MAGPLPSAVDDNGPTAAATTTTTSGLSEADHAGLKQLHFHNDSLLNGGAAYAVAHVDGGDSSSSSDCSELGPLFNRS